MAPMAYEETLPLSDGPHTYLSNKFPLIDNHGLAYALCVISADITDRLRANEQLKHANTNLSNNQHALELALAELTTSHETLKATQLQLVQAAKLESVGTLAAGVAHEVKNPLQAIVMGLDFLDRNTPESNPNIGSVLNDMRDAVNRAKSIIDDLLQLSANSTLALTDEDLNELVNRALHLIQRDLFAAHITVVRNFGDSLPRVKIDRAKIEQVFINLFTNAMHAMSHGGVLTVTTRAGQDRQNAGRTTPGPISPDDTMVIAEVQDSGSGIPEKVLPRIFDPFFSTKSSGSSNGLGLWIVKKIMENHGGEILIRNAQRGGTTATLILKAEPEIAGKQ
jgi:signal transduction histidine kinase